MGGLKLLTLLFLLIPACQIQPDKDAVKLSYRNQQGYELEETRKQLMKLLPAFAKGVPKFEVVQVIQKATGSDVFEKDGCVWVDWIGLKFSNTGKLEHVSPVWNDGEFDPCYPQ